MNGDSGIPGTSGMSPEDLEYIAQVERAERDAMRARVSDLESLSDDLKEPSVETPAPGQYNEDPWGVWIDVVANGGSPPTWTAKVRVNEGYRLQFEGGAPDAIAAASFTASKAERSFVYMRWNRTTQTWTDSAPQYADTLPDDDATTRTILIGYVEYDAATKVYTARQCRRIVEAFLMGGAGDEFVDGGDLDDGAGSPIFDYIQVPIHHLGWQVDDIATVGLAAVRKAAAASTKYWVEIDPSLATSSTDGPGTKAEIASAAFLNTGSVWPADDGTKTILRVCEIDADLVIRYWRAQTHYTADTLFFEAVAVGDEALGTIKMKRITGIPLGWARVTAPVVTGVTYDILRVAVDNNAINSYGGAASHGHGDHDSHTHTVDSHTHTGPSHNHGMDHYHEVDNHAHGLTEHNHPIQSVNIPAGDGTETASSVNSSTDMGGAGETDGVVDYSTAALETGSPISNTEEPGPMVNTGDGGTGSTGGTSLTTNGPSATLDHDPANHEPPYWRLMLLERTAITT